MSLSKPRFFVVGGYQFTLTLDSEGTIWGFGSNKSGELGINLREENYLPTRIYIARDIVCFSCANEFSLCVDSSGFVWKFGGNDFNGEEEKVAELTNIIFVTCGDKHAACIDNDEKVWLIGEDEQMNLSSEAKIQLPFDEIVDAACGANHTLLVKKDGNLLSLGRNNHGQLGRLDGEDPVVPFFSKKPALYAVCGSWFSLVMTESGSVYAFGFNAYGQCGIGELSEEVSFPRLVTLPNEKKIARISCGYYHSMFVDEDDYLWTCGRNEFGALGYDGDSNKPKKVTNIPRVQEISYGGCHTIVKDTQGTIWSFGWNQSLQLGYHSGTEINNKPTPIEGYDHIIGQNRVFAKSARK